MTLWNCNCVILIFWLWKQVPLSHISEKVYKTSVDWISQRSPEALQYFITWSLDTILDDLAIQAARGSKKVAQQAPSKSQVSFSHVMLRVYRMLLNLREWESFFFIVLICNLANVYSNIYCLMKNLFYGSGKWTGVDTSRGDICIGKTAPIFFSP